MLIVVNWLNSRNRAELIVIESHDRSSVSGTKTTVTFFVALSIVQKSMV